MEHKTRYAHFRARGWGAVLAVAALAAACAKVPVRDKRVVYAEQSMKQRADRSVEGRAIWVTRWDYKTPEDIERIVDNCARMHFNMILFQVRGNATVFYRSSLEPWAWELTGDGPHATGNDPGFDPLALAVARARKRNVELHAYMNVFPAWHSQKYPPPEAGQLWTRHPEWFMVDRQGRKMIPRDKDVDPTGPGTWYSFVSPGIPAVQDHVVAVFREVAERYDVDGLHLDYVRYPHEIGDFSYDAVSLARFREETGMTPDQAPDRWLRWRGRQVSRVVQRIHDECTRIAPHLMITAAVGGDPFRARDLLMQRSMEWMAAGRIDAAVPMVYTADNAEVARAVTVYVNNGSGRLVFAGLMAPRNEAAVQAFLHQIGVARSAGAHGVSIFSYKALFPEHKPNALAKALVNGPFHRRAVVPLPPTERRPDLFDDDRRPIEPPPH